MNDKIRLILAKGYLKNSFDQKKLKTYNLLLRKKPNITHYQHFGETYHQNYNIAPHYYPETKMEQVIGIMLNTNPFV